MTPADLIAFEREVADHFNAGRIRAPVHLAGGNEQQLLDIFERVDKDRDWICGAWRMHYHCLLKGVPPDQLMADILAGRSITLCYPEHKVITSAIVGGIIPIALGIAWALKRAGEAGRVWCFVGDMTSQGGIYQECWMYASNCELPLTLIDENNKMSVGTPTHAAWMPDGPLINSERAYAESYSYKLPWPHAGAGKRINF